MHPLEANSFVYNNQIRYGNVPAATTPFNPTVECQSSLLNPTYNISPVDYLVHQSIKPTIHSVDSSVTFNSENNGNNVDFLRPGSSSSPKKRRREESVLVSPMPSQKRSIDPLMFLGQDLSSNVQHHSFDIDRLISNHVSDILHIFRHNIFVWFVLTHVGRQYFIRSK